MIADDCYKAESSGDQIRFVRFFVSLLATSSALHARLNSQLVSLEPEAAIPYVTAPIEDLLAISGFAIVYSELDGKSFWTLVKNCWDKWLASLTSAPGASEFLQYLLTTISYRRLQFAVLPGDLRRSAWGQDLARRLRERGLASDLFSSRAWEIGRDEPNHPSPLIRLLAKSSPLTQNPTDIFAAYYLMKRPEAVGLETPASVRNFAARLERETGESATGGETQR
jgi:hypothetical protein